MAARWTLPGRESPIRVRCATRCIWLLRSPAAERCDVLTPADLKALLRAHGLRLSKRLGQHYLIEPSAIRRIVEACALSRQETAVEIGAGLGALTEPLAAVAGRVVAVEVDHGICPLLAERMRPWPQVTVECRDILTLEDTWLNNTVVVGAIPYHITSPIMVWLTERRRLVRRAILVIQSEVADRLTARPGTKAYGRLSVLAQYGWQVREFFTIPRSAFFPQPDVDSACVQLLPQAQPPVPVEQEALLFSVVKAAFSQRRKTLVNCLLSGEFGLTRQALESVVEGLGHPPAIRGEAFSLAQFAELANALMALRV